MWEGGKEADGSDSQILGMYKVVKGCAVLNLLQTFLLQIPEQARRNRRHFTFNKNIVII